ncbi:MAG: hypothetical protein KC800_01205 [Candidatus Eremiobacteraeota bacterium]|nr:hypothetical protein [Candidatus Eremiobacteraeota bacterium]
MNDIPIRTVVRESDKGWTAHCLDFSLQAVADSPNDALDLLEKAMEHHLKQAAAREVELFRPASPDLWALYYQAAEARLLHSGPNHGHLEHRPLLLDSVATPTSSS